MTHLIYMVLGINSLSLRPDSDSLTGFIRPTLFINNLHVVPGLFIKPMRSITCPLTHDLNTFIMQKNRKYEAENDSTLLYLIYKLYLP